jgi:hypothetical protein
MAGEQGRKYEITCNTKLLQKKLLPKPLSYYGGSDNTAPDGEFLYKGKIYKVEYKLDMKADFGQSTLDYDKKKNRWYVTGKNTKEGLQIQELMRGAGVENLINSNQGWKKSGIPNKFNVEYRVTKQQAKEDYEEFPNKYVRIDRNSVNKYYAEKDTYYIQIGNYGLYYMEDNPADLDIPKFLPDLRVRMRLKAGGSGLNGVDYYNYRFVCALQIVNPTRIIKSSYDIEKDTSFLISLHKK